jgi:hypothetical protein
MVCVVCGKPVVERHFANAWEASRKIYACCSTACASRFDPDEHWIPGTAPMAATPDDEARLLRVCREQIRSGDRPSIVIREMLVAGIGIPGLRKILIDAQLTVDATNKNVSRLNILGVIAGLLGGWWRVHERRDRRDPKLLATAEADLAVWESRFGTTTR